MGKRKSEKKSLLVTEKNDNWVEIWISRTLNFLKNYDNILLFLFCFLIFDSYTKIRMGGDTLPAQLLPINLLFNHSIFFDNYISGLNYSYTSYAFLLINGHYVSLFPIVTPILITPIYIVSSILAILLQIPLSPIIIQLIAKMAAAFVAALACLVFYLVVKLHFSSKLAMVLTFVFAFATSTWSIGSQALWQHGMSELLLLLMIYIIIRNEQGYLYKNLVALGLVAGLFIFNRPPDALLILPILIYVILWYREKFWYFAVGGLITGLPFALFNFIIYGTLVGGYVTNIPRLQFTLETFQHFFGLMIAPNKGLLVFSPILILSIFGFLVLYRLKTDRIRSLLMWFGPAIFLTIIIYSLFDDWMGGYSYGPRYLTGFIPVIVIYIGIFFNDCLFTMNSSVKKNFYTVIITILILISTVIQVIGVFYYPYLIDVKMDNSRAWDLQNLTILMSYKDGASNLNSFTVQSIPPLPPLFDYSSNLKKTVLMADKFLINGNYEQAAIEYDKVLEINPNYYDALNNKGICLLYLNQPQDALIYFDRAIQVDPTSENAWFNKGLAYYDIGQYNKSYESFSTAAKINPINKSTKDEMNKLSQYINETS